VGQEVVLRRGATLVRRQTLAPGEATPWHRDACHRVSVVIRGDALELEYRDGGTPERFPVQVGEAGWDEPTGRIHRARNVVRETFEEVTVFFLDRADTDPQPAAPD